MRGSVNAAQTASAAPTQPTKTEEINAEADSAKCQRSGSALIILVSALADTLGLGQEPRFGWKQGIGLAVGLGLVVGSILWRRASR
jgi:hypothetical protein